MLSDFIALFFLLPLLMMILVAILVIAITIPLILFWVWMLIDCFSRKFKGEYPTIHKLVWILAIVLFQLVGAIVYFLIVKKNIFQTREYR